MFVVLIIMLCSGVAILIGIGMFELTVGAGSHNPSAHTLQQALDYHGTKTVLKSIQNAENLNSSQKAQNLLSLFPVIDGHNDLPWNLRKVLHNHLQDFNFSADLTQIEPWASNNKSFTDLPRLRKGQVGAQFWVAYTNCQAQDHDAVVQVLEQVDIIHQLIAAYPKSLTFCTTAKCILETSWNRQGIHKIASLIGAEGGHMIQNSVGVLRQLYSLGVRYLTLTHGCNTPWADASPVDNPESGIKSENQGLSWWGVKLIKEMNRIGMMIDLSHVSEQTMIKALQVSKAPVIFSHSGAKAICNVHRNVADNVLKMLVKYNINL